MVCYLKKALHDFVLPQDMPELEELKNDEADAGDRFAGIKFIEEVRSIRENK